MKTLVITFGLPGSRKSTWIKENNIEQFVLSPDSLREMFSGIVLTEHGEYMINQENETQVWKVFNKTLENRMEKGEFIVVDATHCSLDSLMGYKKLVEKYRYRIFLVRFDDIPYSTIMESFENRKGTYKFVPIHAIERMSKDMENIVEQGFPKYLEVIERHEFKEKVLANFEYDFSNYEKIHFIGDIHGCYTVLKEYLGEGINPNHAYVFTGDYFERGIENGATFKLLERFMSMKNVYFLEGNHEAYVFQFGNDEKVKCREFANVTSKELIDYGVSKSDMRRFYRKLRQSMVIKFHNKKVLVTHGGLSTFPTELVKVPMGQIIRGVGGYDTDIDEIFTTNVKEMDSEFELYQVHGHRNQLDKDVINGRSINLEGGIENGEYLRAVTLSVDGFVAHEVRNTVFNTKYKSKKIGKNTPIKEVVEILRESKFIFETDNGDGISSFNFNQQAFYDGVWNSQTTKARGLHIDVENNEIVARSFDKFFNIPEYDLSED